MGRIPIEEWEEHLYLIAALTQNWFGLPDQALNWERRTTTPAGGVILGREYAKVYAKMAIPVRRADCFIVMDCQVEYRDGRWDKGIVIVNLIGKDFSLGPAVFKCRRLTAGVVCLNFQDSPSGDGSPGD